MPSDWKGWLLLGGAALLCWCAIAFPVAIAAGAVLRRLDRDSIDD